MNYSDFPDLQVDDFCGTRFGEQGQLEVIGRYVVGVGKKSERHCVIQCNVCSKDPELFGDGLFTIRKGNLMLGGIPCGCSKAPWWTGQQQTIRLTREASKRGYTFVGFVEDKYKGSTTKVIFECKEHGRKAMVIGNFFTGRGCNGCAIQARTQCQPTCDSVHIEQFNSTGAFPHGTVFTRSNRRSSQGYKSYWKVTCPICEDEYTAYLSNLKSGNKGCSCALDQREAYINTIKNGGRSVGVKFGIATVAKRRVADQHRQSIYDITNYSTHRFPTSTQCKAAERECKQTLTCGIIPKSDMPDGYTETTYLYNIDKIRAIYEKHGGVLIT